MEIALIRKHIFWISLAVVVVITGMLGDYGRELLRYQPDMFVSGEYWRIITAHFVHLSWMHTFFNLAGTAIFSVLFARHLSVLQWWWVLAFCVPASSLAFYFLNPNLDWYVGFSGVLHSILIVGGIMELRKKEGNDRRLALLVLGVITAKLIQEQFWGGMESTTESIIAGKVFVDAHLYGAIFGVICGVFYIISSIFDKRQDESEAL
ncbi:MAG: rhombosortase [Gammaproteobacteria bacterium]|nr:MAG: rhombosortase [Gammaproteobacteria bacterium]